MGALGSGCGGSVQHPHTAMHYAEEAQQRYEHGMQLMRDEQWAEATEAFRGVRREYGLSRWGWLAELRIADIDFKQDKFAEALSGYRNWVRYHPTQPDAVYAHFMI